MVSYKCSLTHCSPIQHPPFWNQSQAGRNVVLPTGTLLVFCHCHSSVEGQATVLSYITLLTELYSNIDAVFWVLQYVYSPKVWHEPCTFSINMRRAMPNLGRFRATWTIAMKWAQRASIAAYKISPCHGSKWRPVRSPMRPNWFNWWPEVFKQSPKWQRRTIRSQLKLVNWQLSFLFLVTKSD